MKIEVSILNVTVLLPLTALVKLLFFVCCYRNDPTTIFHMSGVATQIRGQLRRGAASMVGNYWAFVCVFCALVKL